MEKPNEEIIDLTSLDYCYPCNSQYNPRNNVIICEEVIDLVDESFESENKKHCEATNINQIQSKAQPKKTIERTKDDNTTKIGLCSICWDKLGKNPLASTKCGHVYCLGCLEKCLKRDKRCPTCRCNLRGATAYHPLYLELG